MQEYQCWNYDEWDEDKAVPVMANSPSDAAERFVISHERGVVLGRERDVTVGVKDGELDRYFNVKMRCTAEIHELDL